MGPELIEKGCLAFVGYSNVAYALEGENQQISIDCDNRALKQFIQGLSLIEAVNDMKEFIAQTVSDLIDKGDIAAAGYLRGNLSYLTVEGDLTLTFADFA